MKKIIIIVICVLLVALFASVISGASIITDYTDIYALHTKLSSFDSLKETLTYLDTNDIQYQISNNELFIKDSKLVYTISGNLLIPSEDMRMFSELDSGNSIKVKEKTVKKNGESINALYINQYYKSGDIYYKDENFAFLIIPMILVLSLFALPCAILKEKFNL